MFEDIDGMTADPARTLQILRSLGVEAVRVPLVWTSVAAQPFSAVPRTGNDYPNARWATYDAIDREARKDGIRVEFLLTGGAPQWAIGPGQPARDPARGVWHPSPSAFGQFVAAAGARYSGRYTPAGAASPLPLVRFWEIWNEPNWSSSLQPQFVLHPVRIASAVEYRSLLDAAWNALQRTGHGDDTILIGNLSPRGTPTVALSPLAAAAYDVASPLAFARSLYCVDPSYHPLRGSAAADVGCPTTEAGSRRFRRAHPALFSASGLGIHPYPVNLPPIEADTTNPETVEFSQIPHLVSTMERLQHVYGSDQKMGIYITEYGYITHPPNANVTYLSPQRAGSYLNWTEYLEWRNPQIASTIQYLLYDPPSGLSEFGPGGFASGLASSTGKTKASFYAYRMPIWMPLTRTGRGHRLEVWGCARPSTYAYRDTHRPQYVWVQLANSSTAPFQTIGTVRLAAQRDCYFDVAVKFPRSGIVRLAWAYPTDDSLLFDPLVPRQKTIYSRSVTITIR